MQRYWAKPPIILSYHRTSKLKLRDRSSNFSLFSRVLLYLQKKSLRLSRKGLCFIVCRLSFQTNLFFNFRESYLRFCSQKFRLTDFHESIHLCNHAVQCKYKNCVDRDPALPADNMWDATTFKEFLK